ncbi:lasso peptide biosynthesis B2 protein [Pullulanibacillus camelliae]|nr:lasso peptide biosynthesis B2 protein [Pullulanibacillus camelliae]
MWRGLHRVRLLLELDRKTVGLFLEAFFYLGWARLLIALPFSKVSPSLGVHMRETSHLESKHQRQTLRCVQQAITLVSRHTLWRNPCLVKAITAVLMLKRRNIACTLYLGTAKDDEGNMIAHAWVRSGSRYITGAEEMDSFTVVGTFASEISG